MRTSTSGIPTRNYYPWLNDEPPIPFRYGDYGAICRRYLPPDYRADAAPFVVEKSVYVEAEWDPRDPVGETRYIDELRREHGLPTVTVAQAWLDRADAPRVLEQQAAFDFVRSVRHKPRANPSPDDAAPGGTTDAKWRAGYAAARAQRPALRPADAVVAPRRSRAARRRLSGHDDHPEPHRACRPIAAPRASPAGSAR